MSAEVFPAHERPAVEPADDVVPVPAPSMSQPTSPEALGREARRIPQSEGHDGFVPA